MDAQTRTDLQSLNETYLRSTWLAGGRPEPCIGSIDCPQLAEKYAVRGMSCLAVFVFEQGDGKYGCLHEQCYQGGTGRGPAFRSMNDAVRHQKRHHFS